MTNYLNKSTSDLKKELDTLYTKLHEYQSMNLTLNMARGKPCKEQLDLSMPMLDVLSSKDVLNAEDGTDCRNYGVLTGIEECKKIFADLLDVETKNVIVGGNASLKLMYDTIAHAFLAGVNGNKPWSQQGKIRWLCPVPGYDRHFAICEFLNIEMINIPMHENGPDMDMIEDLVNKDETIKGIWCVPKYSNPDGITYSDDVVRRFANLKPKAKDFRIFWDNAYCIHDLDDSNKDELLNIFDECNKAGNPDLVYEFASTSKISFPGSGVSVLISSENNIKDITNNLKYQTIGYDKINQLRHVKFFKTADGIKEQMKKHAAILKPKFDLVASILNKEIVELGLGHFVVPKGGYFISLYLNKGCATKVFNLCKESGLSLTQVGAAYPYHKDPDDSNLRIAPSFPSLNELEMACNILTLAIKIVSIEQKLNLK